MKKKIILLLFIIFMVSGCSLNKNSMEDIDIYTTNYASTYITQKLYGNHANITSIYPNGTNINNYKLTDKQINDYSASDLYIFNSLSAKEKEYVIQMRNKNDDLKIIDASLSMEYTNGIEELWLDPSNFLMMAGNIKKGFGEYIDNYYLNQEIEENYEQLKLNASSLDAKIKQLVTNSTNKTIVSTSNTLKYLEKYGLTVYSIENNTENSSKTLDDVKKLINKNQIHYIFVLDNNEISNELKELIKGTNVQTVNFNSLSNITSDEINANEDYFTLMNENLELLRDELY